MTRTLILTLALTLTPSLTPTLTLSAQAVCCNASALTGRPCALYGQPEARQASFDPATFDAAFPSLGGGRAPPTLLAHCLPSCFTDGLLARDRRAAISPHTSPPHLPHISPISPLYLPCHPASPTGCARGTGTLTRTLARARTPTLTRARAPNPSPSRNPNPSPSRNPNPPEP